MDGMNKGDYKYGCSFEPNNLKAQQNALDSIKAMIQFDKVKMSEGWENKIRIICCPDGTHRMDVWYLDNKWIRPPHIIEEIRFD